MCVRVEQKREEEEEEGVGGNPLLSCSSSRVQRGDSGHKHMHDTLQTVAQLKRKSTVAVLAAGSRTGEKSGQRRTEADRAAAGLRSTHSAFSRFALELRKFCHSEPIRRKTGVTLEWIIIIKKSLTPHSMLAWIQIHPPLPVSSDASKISSGEKWLHPLYLLSN